MSLLINSHQIPDNGFLDVEKQTYLGNAFIAGTMSGNIGSTSETPYVLIRNTATNTKSMFVFIKKHSIIITSAAIATFRYYANPTVTVVGNTLTPINLRANAASPASTILVTQAPTVSANGTFIADIATTNSGAPTVSTVLSIVDPGTSILVTCTASSGSAPVAYEVCWYELPYGSGL